MRVKILPIYIAKNVLASIGLVTLMLAGLQIFILFVHELDDLGKAHYGIMQAMMFVFLQMPYQVYLFFPMASLLGSLIGLGLMANHRELVVIRAAGMSIWQVTLAVLQAALFLVILVTTVSETMVPKLAKYANDEKLTAMSQGQALRTSKGIWLRSHHDFIAVTSMLPNQVLEQVFQFHFDEQHHLRFARKIDRISYHDGVWVAQGVDESIIGAQSVTALHRASMPWDVVLQPNLLSVSAREPDEMTLFELYRVIHAQKDTPLVVYPYQLAYWQRLIQPLTTAVMMVLAIPFIFGPLRSATMGAKLLAGATVGFGFHMVNRFFGPVSQVLQWPVEIAALGPTILFALFGVYLMRRVR